MLEIQIGFQRSNTSLYSLLAWRIKNNLSQSIIWTQEKQNPKIFWNRMNCLVSTCTDQTLKKVQVMQQRMHFFISSFIWYALATAVGFVWVIWDWALECVCACMRACAHAFTVLWVAFYIMCHWHNNVKKHFHRAVLFAFPVVAC